MPETDSGWKLKKMRGKKKKEAREAFKHFVIKVWRLPSTFVAKQPNPSTCPRSWPAGAEARGHAGFLPVSVSDALSLPGLCTQGVSFQCPRSSSSGGQSTSTKFKCVVFL